MRRRSVRFYIASRFERYQDARKVRRLIRNEGHEVQAQWLDRAGDKRLWQAEAVAAQQDVDDLMGADMVLLLTSVPRQGYTTGGSHTEFGMAMAAGIPVAVLGRRENVFHHLPQVRQFESPGELVNYLRELNNGTAGDADR
jgi:hypothetical protein